MTATSLALGAVARTREVALERNLFDELAPDGFAWVTGSTRFVTSGTVARMPASAAAEVLSSLTVEDDVQCPGSGPIAVGALPFYGTESGELVIPARVTGISDGRAWVTEIGSATPRPAPRPPAPTHYVVERRMSRAAWRQSVNTLLGEIATGRLEKAVLAREVLITVDEALDARTVVERLLQTQDASYIFAAAGLVGASPELLVRRQGSTVLSRPMAGTVARGRSVEADAAAAADLASSAKNAAEHRIVVDAVVESLRGCGVVIDRISAPELAHLADVSHLATVIDGRADREPRPSALEIACALHPTPAVGGTPRDEALRALRELEGFDRGRYAGPVGWVDASGDGEWAVALRCGELDGTHARLFAGAGIVSGSDPDAEWDETEVKLEPMLRAIVRP